MGNKKVNLKSRILSNPLVYFSLYFISLVIVAILLNNAFLSQFYTKFIIENGKSYFSENINKRFELKRELLVEQANDNQDEIILTTIFYDKKNSQGGYQAKNIRINVIYEGLLPILFVLVLTLSIPVPWKRKLISALIAFILMNLYVYFKFYAFAYDNYSSPDFILKELSFPTSQIVYAYNYFISISGYSFNLVIAVIIFTISAIRRSDLESFSEILQNKIN